MSYSGHTGRDLQGPGEPRNFKCACRLPHPEVAKPSSCSSPDGSDGTGYLALGGCVTASDCLQLLGSGETPGSQASPNSSHQSFWGEAGVSPGSWGSRLTGL